MQEANLYSVTIPPIGKALRNLSGILDKAVSHAATKSSERHPVDVRAEAILQDRLIFDQFPLARQIQIATDNAKGGAARLAGIEAPKYEDTESTVEELKTRIAKTIEFIESIKPDQIIGQEERPVTLPYYPDKPMTAFGYATEYLLPNFYFHIVTAYSILRKNGVDLGKNDFIGGLPFIDNA